MAGQEPLLPKPAASKRAKLSVLYGADEYLEELKKKYAVDHEIATLKAIMPDQGDPNAGKVQEGTDKMMKLEKDESNRSKKTKHLEPSLLPPVSKGDSVEVQYQGKRFS